ncbi:MAG: hypothetical protein AMXMBFR36_14590 [Acidobacteriota bacterium]
MRFETTIGRPAAALAVAGWLLASGATRAQLTIDGAVLFEQGVAGFPDDAEASDVMGRRLATGDFDGDGRDDLAIAAQGETVFLGAEGAGQVTVLYGGAGGLDPTSGETWALDWTAHGPGAWGDGLGSALAVGDFDDDGHDDLAIGIPNRDIASGGGPIADAGAVLVLYGGPSGLSAVGSQLWRQGAGGVDGVPEAQDFFGSALASGDFNGDAFSDLAIGVHGEDVGAVADSGAVNVIYGSPSGLSTDFAPISDQIWVQGDLGLSMEEPEDSFGFELAAGDLDGDGRDDLAVGAPGEDVGAIADAGAVSVLYGSGLGVAADGARFVTQNDAVPAEAEAGDGLGFSLAIADFDGDGFDDLAAGSPFEDVATGGGTAADAGAVFLLRGSASGLEEEIAWRLTRGNTTFPSTSFDYLGWALAAGRYDGGGTADLAIGARGVTIGAQSNAGAAFVFSGRSGAPPLFAIELSQGGLVPGAPEVDDSFGSALAAGDFDGDGFDDLAAGVPGDSAGGAEDAGVVNIFINQGLFRDGFDRGDAERWSDAVAN